MKGRAPARGLAGERRRKSLTQMQLAILLGVQQITVTRWECGTRRPSPAHLERTAKILGTSIDALLASAPPPEGEEDAA